jgi:uncharacterized protein (DUF1330 family)
MAVTVIAHTTINEEAAEALGDYLKVALPLLDSVGARIVQRYKCAERVVGVAPAETIIVVEYPDRAAIDAVFQSAAYKSIEGVRDEAFLTYRITIVEENAEG